jgi:hypothetical protein
MKRREVMTLLGGTVVAWAGRGTYFRPALDFGFTPGWREQYLAVRTTTQKGSVSKRQDWSSTCGG